MRLHLLLWLLFAIGSFGRGQLPEVYSVAKGYYTLEPAPAGMNRLSILVPPEAEGYDWVLLDTQGHAWPFAHRISDGQELLFVVAPVGRPLRFLYGRFPAEFRTDSVHAPPDPSRFVRVAFSGHHLPQQTPPLTGLQRPLRMLGIWFLIAVVSFTMLGKWYRNQIS